MKAQLLTTPDLQEYLQLQQLLPLVAPLNTLMSFIQSLRVAGPHPPVDFVTMQAPIEALLARRTEMLQIYQHQARALQEQTKTVHRLFTEIDQTWRDDSVPWVMSDEDIGVLKATLCYFSLTRSALHDLVVTQAAHTKAAIRTLAPLKRQLTLWVEADKQAVPDGEASRLQAILSPTSPIYLFIDQFSEGGVHDYDADGLLLRFSQAALTMFARNIGAEDRVQHSIALLMEYYLEIETQCALVEAATTRFAARLAVEHIQRLCKELDTLLSDFALIPVPTVN